MASTDDDKPTGKSKDLVVQNKRPKQIKELGVEVGIDHRLAFTTPFTPTGLNARGSVREHLHEVMKEEGEEAGPTIRQLVSMRRMDGQARALFRLLTLPIRSALATAEFVAAEGGEKEAEFMNQMWTLSPDAGGMSVTSSRFMSQLLGALFDGYAVFEKVFWIPTSGPLEGKITMRKLAYRPSETITFVQDEQGGFGGVRQRSYSGGKVTDVYIAPEYCFYYAAQEDERKFYGVSYFQSAFYHYDKKVKLYYTAHLAAQRAAVGTRVGTVPPNASRAAKTEFQSSLGNLAFAQWMMMPEGFKVEILKEAGGFDFLNLINHHNSQMSKSMLAAFFDQDTGKGSNDNTLVNFAQPGDDMFILMLRSLMDEIAKQIDHYLTPQLIDFNFDGGKYPTFSWGTLTDEQKAAISVTFDKLANERTVTPEFIRALEETQAKEFGLDVDYEEVEEREAQEAAMASQGFGADGQPIADFGGAPGGEMGPDGMPLPGPEGGAPAPAGVPPGGAPPATDDGGGEPTEDPDTWQSLQDFEQAIGAVEAPPAEEEEEPVSLADENPDDWESVDDLEASLGYGQVALTEPSNLLSLAQNLLDAALQEEYANA